jgi:CCR4-NOT complex subunit CAF16
MDINHTAPSAPLAIDVEGLWYDYGGPPVLRDVNLKIERGARCLLVGGNGTGKSTLLRILAGKNLTRNKVHVLGRDAYRNTPEGITYLGGEWAGNPVVRRDVSVPQLLSSVNAEKFPERRDRLMELLDVDLGWHMHQVSDGERRRVQLLMGLVQPYDVLLLDEVTVDLDVLVRRDLLNFLKTESETRGVTIIYATHIFDGIGEFATHIIHLDNGSVTKFHKLEHMPELVEIRKERFNLSINNGDDSSLLLLVERWLRGEFEKKAKRRKLGENEPVVQTRLEILKDSPQYGDKFYNYWK